MVGCDARPRYPPDRTVRGDRRPRDPIRPAPARPAEEALRRRAGVPGGRPGAAGRPLGAPLAAPVLRPARAPVPLPAQATRLPQAAESRRSLTGRGDGPPGPPVTLMAGPSAAYPPPPRAPRYRAGDGPAVRAGRVGWLRVLRRAFPLVLGAEAVPDHCPGRDARRLVPGQPEDRRTRGSRRTARACPPHRL